MEVPGFRLSPYWKAVVGAAGAGLGSLGVALADGGLTSEEALIAIGVACVTLGGVWRVPNRDSS